MRFLIAIYNQETARQNLQFAALLASRLSTDITILYVEPNLKRSLMPEMTMAKSKMHEWHMDSTGYLVLREARDHLSSMGLIKDSYREGELRQLISLGKDHLVEMPGATPEVRQVTFRYREGDSLGEILNEMREHHHEILVIGAANNGDFLTKLQKFSPASILIVKNPKDLRYKILVATDGTPPAHRAELLAIKTASFLNRELSFVTVPKNKVHHEFMEKHLERMSGVAKMKKVKHNIIYGQGDIVKATTDIAGNDHIIFLGRSRRKALAKLFLGSKTIKIVSEADCPLLLVK